MESGTLPVFLTMTGRLSVSPFFQVSAVGVTLARGSDTRAPRVTATVFEPAGEAGAVLTVIVEVPAAVVARVTETESTSSRLRQTGSGTFVDREIPAPVFVMLVISSRSSPWLEMPKVNVLCVAPKLSVRPLSLSWPGLGACWLASAGSGAAGSERTPAPRLA